MIPANEAAALAEAMEVIGRINKWISDNHIDDNDEWPWWGIRPHEIEGKIDLALTTDHDDIANFDSPSALLAGLPAIAKEWGIEP